MTLNCRFALKSDSSSTSNGLAFLAFGKKTVRTFAERCIDCRRPKNAAPHCTGDIIGLFAGVPLRGSVKQVNCIHNQFLDVLFTDIENK